MRLGAVCAISLLVLCSPALPAPRVTVSAGPTFTGACEPSGAVAVPDGSLDGPMIIASDENNVLLAYDADEGRELTFDGGDLNPFLNLDGAKDDDKVDFEAAAWLGDRAYFIGSHSRSNKGNRRTQRETILALRFDATGEALTVVPVGRSQPDTLLSALQKLETRPFGDAIRLDEKKHAELAPEKEGFNLEGMTAAADHTSLVLGVRNPLTSNKEAILFSLENPAEVVDGGVEPRIGSVTAVDLGGRGVRALEYSAAASIFYLVGGPARDTGDFQFYRWSGPGAAAELVPEVGAALAGLTDFHPEAMMVDATGMRIRLLSDDGNFKGTRENECQERSSRDDQSFRSIMVTFE